MLVLPRATRSLVAAWARWTEPSPRISNEELRRNARLVLSILLPLTWLAMASVIVLPLVNPAGVSWTTPSTVVAALSCALLLGAYVISRSRSFEYGAVLIVGVAIVGTWNSYFANHGVPDAVLILAFLSVGPIVSSLLLPPMYTLTTTALEVVGLAALPWIDPSITWTSALTLIVLITMVGLLVLVSDAVRRRDARARARTEDDLRLSEQRFRAAFDSTAVGRGVATPEGKWVQVNDALCGIVGYSKEEILSPQFETLSIPDERPMLTEAWTRMLSGEVPTMDVEARWRHKQGHLVWVRLVGSVARGPDGRPLYVVGDAQDITERRQVDEARMLALERLSEIARLKDVNAFKTQLLNTASHELNTPIATLRLQLHMLKKGMMNEGAKERSIAILDRNVERLALLVKDVLDVARLESGQLKLRKEPLALAPLLAEAAESYEEAARAVGVRLEVRVAPDLEVEGDPQRVTQVVTNLISNALKFTPHGGEVVLDAQPSEGGAALVRVRDTGTGLTPEQMTLLFQPFSQVHDTQRSTQGGTGLGLHICKGIVEEHGGRIWVESAGADRGSTFAFTLPGQRPTFLSTG